MEILTQIVLSYGGKFVNLAIRVKTTRNIFVFARHVMDRIYSRNVTGVHICASDKTKDAYC